MTEHTPPTAAEIAANLTASTRKHCTSCADRPRMCPHCDLYDDGVTDMLTALEVAGLLPDENGISHTEPAALPETPSAALIACSDCDGIGQDDNAPLVCPTCDGTGQVMVPSMTKTVIDTARRFLHGDATKDDLAVAVALHDKLVAEG